MRYQLAKIDTSVLIVNEWIFSALLPQRHHLERSATGDDVSPVAVFVPSASEVAPLQTIVPRPRLLNILLSDCLC